MTLEVVTPDPEVSPHATHQPQAERALLAAVLSGHPVAAEMLAVVAGRDFYQPRNEAVWEACLNVSLAGDRIDPVTLPVPPQAKPYVLDLVTAGAEPLAAPRYARLVVDAAQRRRLVEASIKVRQLAEQGDDAAQAAEDARHIIDEAAERLTDTDAGVGAAELVIQTLDTLDSGIDSGIGTGWSDLDEQVGGLRPGQLAIVGARPAVGKSVIAANIAAAACKAGTGVHFASLEMTRDEVMKRMLAAYASVDLARLMAHQLTETDWTRIAGKSGDIGAWPLWVDDQGGQALAQLRARARSTSRRMNLGLIVVDYLQLMAPRDRRVPREQQVGELSEGLKSLAKELHLPVLALAQVNRGSAERRDHRPLMSDLRESGRIEADADHVWLLHRPDLYDENSTTGEIEIHIAKNRNGPAGRTVKLNFFGHYSRADLRVFDPTRGLS